MQVNTYLADSIERTEYESQYDDCAKTLVASIPVLSRILKQTIKELKDYPLDVIEACIEGTPKITFTAEKNKKYTKDKKTKSCKEKISGSNVESTNWKIKEHGSGK